MADIYIYIYIYIYKTGYFCISLFPQIRSEMCVGNDAQETDRDKIKDNIMKFVRINIKLFFSGIRYKDSNASEVRSAFIFSV
jgi:hypothetical protein